MQIEIVTNPTGEQKQKLTAQVNAWKERVPQAKALDAIRNVDRGTILFALLNGSVVAVMNYVEMDYKPAEIFSDRRNLPAKMKGWEIMNLGGRGRGGGTFLINHMIEEAEKQNRVILVNSLPSAESFYQEMGFASPDNGGSFWYVPIELEQFQPYI